MAASLTMQGQRPEQPLARRDAAGDAASAPASAGRPAGLLRIYAGGRDDSAGLLTQAEALGFSHVLASAGAAAGLKGNAGPAILADVRLDRAPAGVADGPFETADAAAWLDPRRRATHGRPARLEIAADTAALAEWWAEFLRRQHGGGIAGFRLLGLAALPDGTLPAFFAVLRAALPAAVLLPWTSGLPRQAVASLRGAGADGVFASSAWWDGRADWLWDELDDLLQVAPVLGIDAAPAGVGHDGAGRIVPALAAMLGQGWLHVASEADDPALLRTLNAALRDRPALAAQVRPEVLLDPGGGVMALLRRDTAGQAGAREALLTLVNTDALRHLAVHADTLLPVAGGGRLAFVGADLTALTPASVVRLRPGQTLLFAGAARAVGAAGDQPVAISAQQAAAAPRLAIEAPEPCVDGGRFPVKAVAGEMLAVQADIVFDGHEKIAASLRWRGPAHPGWRETPMRPLANDRWEGALPLEVLGRHDYVVMAWRDRWGTFRDELQKKSAAGVSVTLALAEGEALVRAAAARRSGVRAFDRVVGEWAGLDEATRVRLLLAPDLAVEMTAADDRPHSIQTAPIPVDAERALARFASWYEIFPRSMSDDPARHGNFADVERHLPRIRDMGFDVLYFPPISPIGRVNRKGRNNTLTPAPADPGSPYAVGSAEGGHDALHPKLGTLADFRHLIGAAASHGLEIAIDFAIQCSPDHPWLRAHRGWFDWRPDGSIKYAENPPKKYEDIVNVDFYAEDAIPGLWNALRDVVLFWAAQGIRIFRVDNPHTKPFPFWEWMIAEVRAQYPDAMFLAEAFTRPKVMYRLAKIGFSQSYTYFTWRNEKAELAEYLTELGTPPVSYFFRPHFFVNTPDINPVFLQGSGRAGFLIRAALAATLSGLFGVYCGFELCEAAAVPGREEYLDSEKYQLRAWDWERPGNIVAEIAALNAIRRRNRALQTHLGVRFLAAANDRVLFFEKATPDRGNVVLVAISLDPHQAQEAAIDLPLWSWRLPDDGALEMDDLLAGGTTVWRGRMHRASLTPDRPYAIWRARAAS